MLGDVARTMPNLRRTIASFVAHKTKTVRCVLHAVACAFSVEQFQFHGLFSALWSLSTAATMRLDNYLWLVAVLLADGREYLVGSCVYECARQNA